MTIQYKNQGFKQVDTSKATVLTCPTTGAIIVKRVVMAVPSNILLAFLYCIVMIKSN